MVTEESTKDTVKTIAQGMPVDAVYLWLLTRVLSCCTRGLGCNAHPAFPAPSSDFEGGSFPTTRTFRAARPKTRVGNHVAAHPSRRGAIAPLLRMRSSQVARSQTLMVRRRGSAVSNHEAPVAQSGLLFENRIEMQATTLATSSRTSEPTGRANARPMTGSANAIRDP